MANAFLQRMQNDQEWPWEQKARDELNDNPLTNDENLSCFKDKIREFAGKNPKFRPQLDDDLLMAYLRTCKFDLQLAMASYKKFNKVRLCHPEKIFPVGKGPKDYLKYYEKPVVAPLKRRNPLDGTIVFVYSFRNFDKDEDVLDDIFNAAFTILMEIVSDPSIQTYGVRFLVDYTGVNYSVIKSAIGKMYYNKASLMAQESCPITLKGIHILEAPGWIVTMINTLFRPFFSTDVSNMINFHSSIEELHQFISPSILPDIFGGSAGPFEGTWMKEAIEETHDEVVRKSYYGFIEI